MATEVHLNYGCQINATMVGAIENQNLPTNTDIENDPKSGSIHPVAGYMVAQRPTADFTTYAIGKMIDTLVAEGSSGAEQLGINLATSNLTLYGYKTTDGGGRAGITSHRTYVFKAGLLLPQTLRADHQGHYSLAMQVLPTYDGTNSIVLISDGVTLPTAALETERYGLGPVTVGGVALTGVRSVEINFGIDARTEGSDGNIWDTLSYVLSARPTITLRGIDIKWVDNDAGSLATIPLLGKQATQANTTITLRRRDVDGGYIAKTSLKHIVINGKGEIHPEQLMSSDGSGPATTELTIPLSKDEGTGNLPLAIATDQSYT